MGKTIRPISQIDSSVTSWSIRAKVIRLCEVIDFDTPNALPSIEMVLMDLKGGRIHATIPNSLSFKYKSQIAEGETYVFKKLSVRINSGNIRTTSHPFKLEFEDGSSLKLEDNSKITGSPYDLIPISALVGGSYDPSILIDLVGVLTGIGKERELELHGTTSKSNVIELESREHKVQCSLFGNYVDHLNNFIKYGDVENAVVTIQFAKATYSKGMIYLHSCLSFTRLIFNPFSSYQRDIFFNPVSLHGFNMSKRYIDVYRRLPPVLLPYLADDSKAEILNEFMYNTPRATIQGLNDAHTNSLAVVIGTVKRIVNASNFAYTACVCRKGMVPESQVFSCEDCQQNGKNLFARYCLRIEVIDEGGCVTLVVLDSDARTMFRKTCSEMLQQNEHAVALGRVPTEISSLLNRTFLFKVEKKACVVDGNQQSFVVRKICFDPHVINEYQKAKHSNEPGKDNVPELLGTACDGNQVGVECNDVGASTNGDTHAGVGAEEINLCLKLFEISMRF